MQVVDQGIEYDSKGRMLYHADYHDRHGKQFTEDELIYLCKFYERDDIRDLSFALGRTESTLRTKVRNLRIEGLYEFYKNREWSCE